MISLPVIVLSALMLVVAVVTAVSQYPLRLRLIQVLRFAVLGGVLVFVVWCAQIALRHGFSSPEWAALASVFRSAIWLFALAQIIYFVTISVLKRDIAALEITDKTQVNALKAGFKQGWPVFGVFAVVLALTAAAWPIQPYPAATLAVIAAVWGVYCGFLYRAARQVYPGFEAAE